MRLNVVGVLQLDGEITANGASSVPERLGGGSGGSIHVVTQTLTGAGSFLANGADGGSATAGGGGGGRVAVYYANGAAYQGTDDSTADGGGGYAPGTAGTLSFVDSVCDGDCDGNGRVTVDELVRGVGMALGSLPSDDCPATDSDGNEAVSIDDLMRAIRRTLDGCTATTAKSVK